MSSSVKYYIYLYTYVITYKYSLLVTYLMMCNDFVFGVANYPLSEGSSSPPFVSFSPKCKSIGYHQDCCYFILHYVTLLSLYICTLQFESLSVVICNYLSICNLII